MEMKKTQIHLNKPAYLGPILELTKNAIYSFWYYYVRPNTMEKQNFALWIQTVLSHT